MNKYLKMINTIIYKYLLLEKSKFIYNKIQHNIRILLNHYNEYTINDVDYMGSYNTVMYYCLIFYKLLCCDIGYIKSNLYLDFDIKPKPYIIAEIIINEGISILYTINKRNIHYHKLFIKFGTENGYSNIISSYKYIDINDIEYLIDQIDIIRYNLININ